MTDRYLVTQKVTNWKTETWPSIATNAHFVDLPSEDISTDRGFVFIESSSQRGKRPHLKGGILTNGDLQVPCYPTSVPSLFYYLLGICTTTGISGVTGLFKHAMKMANVPPNFIAGIGKDKKEHRFAACAMKSCTIDFAVNEPVLATFAVLARKELAAGTLASVTFPDFNADNRAFAGAEVEVKIDNTTIDYIEGATIDITNTIVEDNFPLGDQYLPQKYVQGFDVTGSVSMAYNDYQRYLDIVQETSKKFQFIGEYGDATDLTHRKFEVRLPSLAFNNNSLPTDGSNRYKLDVDIQAEQDSTGNNIYIDFINEDTAAETIA